MVDILDWFAIMFNWVIIMNLKMYSFIFITIIFYVDGHSTITVSSCYVVNTKQVDVQCLVVDLIGMGMVYT